MWLTWFRQLAECVGVDELRDSVIYSVCVNLDRSKKFLESLSKAHISYCIQLSIDSGLRVNMFWQYFTLKWSDDDDSKIVSGNSRSMHLKSIYDAMCPCIWITGNWTVNTDYCNASHEIQSINNNDNTAFMCNVIIHEIIMQIQRCDVHFTESRSLPPNESYRNSFNERITTYRI